MNFREMIENRQINKQQEIIKNKYYFTVRRDILLLYTRIIKSNANEYGSKLC